MNNPSKTISLMLLFSTACLLTSCGGKNTFEDRLCRKWKYQTEIIDETKFDARDKGFYLIFKPDGSLEQNVDAGKESGAWKLSADKKSLNLVMPSSVTPVTFNITTFTDDKLVLDDTATTHGTHRLELGAE